ncbi:MAG: (Fe-S)-binding protein [Candidatus Promineifilaceae bacterium]
MDEPRRVALFVTCIVDQLMPEVGVATVRLLRRAGCEVVFPSQQTCCGQPFFNSGFRKQAEKLAMRSIEIFEEEETVVLPSGSCTAMIRAEYPHLLTNHHGWSQRAERLAAKSYELSEFLVHETRWRPLPGELQGKGSPNPLPSEMGTNVQTKEEADASEASGFKPITYHDSCHMCRHLNLQKEPRQLLSQAGCSLHEMDESDRCCGFGGLFSLRMPEVSTAMTAEKLQQATDSGASSIVSADPGCLMQMRQMTGQDGPKKGFRNGPKMEHLAVILEKMTR